MQQLQKNQTGEISSVNKRKYGKLIKAVSPLGLQPDFDGMNRTLYYSSETADSPRGVGVGEARETANKSSLIRGSDNSGSIMK